MYDITQEDFLKIRREAFHPQTEEAYAATFEVMERMFPGYLYARRASFPCEEDLEDCLMTAQIRIIERLRRYYFEREDMEQSPESLQRWMFTVLKNCHYTVLRQTEGGRAVLQRMEQKAAAELGMTYTAEGRMKLNPEEEGGITDGGFDALYKKEDTRDRRRLLKICFDEILNSKSDVQIVLAWLTVSTLMLVRDIRKKEAIAAIADADPTMDELFRMLLRLLGQLPWMDMEAEDFKPLLTRLRGLTQDGRSVGSLRFGDFTGQSPREYISKSINKRNDALTARHADCGDLE